MFALGAAPHAVMDVNERMDFVGFVMGLWFHTRHLVGIPSIGEAEITLCAFPEKMREWIIARLVADGHVSP